MPMYNEFGVLVDDEMKKIAFDDLGELAHKLFDRALAKGCTMVELSALSRDAELTVSLICSEVKLKNAVESRKKLNN